MSYPAINLTVQDDAGNIVNDVEIEVRREIPGQPLVQIYSDRLGEAALGNPHEFADGSSVRFHVEIGGAFQIKASKGAFEKIWRYVPIARGQESDITVIPQIAPWDDETQFDLGAVASVDVEGARYLFVSRVGGNLNNAPEFDGETGEPEDSEHWLFAGQMPEGPSGTPFQPVYIVPNLTGRDAYDAGPALVEFPPASGVFVRLSVLVESDSSNDDNPTLYFLLEADTGGGATWSDGFTFAPAGGLGIGAALSVVGVAGNSAATRTDIEASAADRILARVGDAIGFFQLTFAMIADAAIASASEICAKTASKIVTAANFFAALAYQALTIDGSNEVEIDLARGRKFTLTAAGTYTLLRPINATPGDEYTIKIINSGATTPGVEAGHVGADDEIPAINDESGDTQDFHFEVDAVDAGTVTAVKMRNTGGMWGDGT